MKTIATIFTLLFSFGSFAQQSKLIIFTKIPDVKFSILVDNQPITNDFAKIINLNLQEGYYSLDIVFEENHVSSVNFTLYISANTMITYQIIPISKVIEGVSAIGVSLLNEIDFLDKIEVKQVKYKLNLLSNVKIGSQTGNEINTHPSSIPIATGSTSIGDENNNMGSNSSDTVYVTYETNIIHEPNINMNFFDFDVNIEEEAQFIDIDEDENNIDCSEPMNLIEFAKAMQAIIQTNNDRIRIIVSNQILTNNCLTVSQVIKILMLFSSEDAKLTFAKKAYLRTTNKKDYYLVNVMFTTDNSVEELNNYIESVK